MQRFRPAVSVVASWARQSVAPVLATTSLRSAATSKAVAAKEEKADVVTKKHVVDAIVDDLGFEGKTVTAVVNAFLNEIEVAVAQNKKVQLTGFGTFKRSERAERQGRNPQTGEPLTIAATAAPAFVAGKGFKDKVKEKYSK